MPAYDEKIAAITPPDNPSRPSITPPENKASITSIKNGIKNQPSSSCPRKGIIMLDTSSFVKNHQAPAKPIKSTMKILVFNSMPESLLYPRSKTIKKSSIRPTAEANTSVNNKSQVCSRLKKLSFFVSSEGKN